LIKNNLFYFLLLCILSPAMLFLFDCGGGGEGSDTSGVYVAGCVSGSKAPSHDACYWKNGVKVDLAGTGSTCANSVFVDASDVYAAGYYDGASYACYWKNGTMIPLDDGMYSEANSIFVYGGDVYVAGYCSQDGKDVACYWVNDKDTRIDLYETTVHSEASSIFVQDIEHVYVAGYYSSGLENRACYWVNEKIMRTDLIEDTNSYTKSIFYAGGSVYVAGYYAVDIPTYHYEACYWVNDKDTRVELNGEADSSEAYSVFVSGSDVYVAGYCRTVDDWVACYWKNLVGNRTDLYTASSASANSVYVSGSDVYVAGHYVEDMYDNACCWKNTADDRDDLFQSDYLKVNSVVYVP
jgi:hypothetical protein